MIVILARIFNRVFSGLRQLFLILMLDIPMNFLRKSARVWVSSNYSSLTGRSATTRSAANLDWFPRVFCTYFWKKFLDGCLRRFPSITQARYLLSRFIKREFFHFNKNNTFLHNHIIVWHNLCLLSNICPLSNIKTRKCGLLQHKILKKPINFGLFKKMAFGLFLKLIFTFLG